MATKNENSTRFYSDKQEKSVCKIINGQQTANSGAGHFNKGDVVNKTASLLCECKCTMTPKISFSVKKEWFEKNKHESFSMRLSNQMVAFNFEPDGENYFIINERLARFLIQKLEEENTENS